MTNFIKPHSIYKLILLIFIACILVNIKDQLVTLTGYNTEIAVLNDKISTLQKEQDTQTTVSNDQKKDTEDIARKDLKMYYPNETPYKGY